MSDPGIFTINILRRWLEETAAKSSVKDRVITLVDSTPITITTREDDDLHPFRTLRHEDFHVQKWADGEDRYLMIERFKTGEKLRVPDSPSVMLIFQDTYEV